MVHDDLLTLSCILWSIHVMLSNEHSDPLLSFNNKVDDPLFHDDLPYDTHSLTHMIKSSNVIEDGKMHARLFLSSCYASRHDNYNLLDAFGDKSSDRAKYWFMS